MPLPVELKIGYIYTFRGHGYFQHGVLEQLQTIAGFFEYYIPRTWKIPVTLSGVQAIPVGVDFLPSLDENDFEDFKEMLEQLGFTDDYNRYVLILPDLLSNIFKTSVKFDQPHADLEDTYAVYFFNPFLGWLRPGRFRELTLQISHEILHDLAYHAGLSQRLWLYAPGDAYPDNDLKKNFYLREYWNRGVDPNGRTIFRKSLLPDGHAYEVQEVPPEIKDALPEIFGP